MRPRTPPPGTVELDGFTWDGWRGGNCAALVTDLDHDGDTWEVVITDMGYGSAPTDDDGQWYLGVYLWDEHAGRHGGHWAAGTELPPNHDTDVLLNLARALIPTAELV